MIFLFDTQKLSPSKLDTILFIYHVKKMFSFIFHRYIQANCFSFPQFRFLNYHCIPWHLLATIQKVEKRIKGGHIFTHSTLGSHGNKKVTPGSLYPFLCFFFFKVGRDWTLAQAIEFQELKILPKGI